MVYPSGTGLLRLSWKKAIKCVVVVVFKPRHVHSMDASCCYTRYGVVCLCVRCGDASCKTAEPIEMPFGMWAQVGPRNHVLDGGQSRSPQGEGQFWVGMPTVSIFNKTMQPFVQLRDLLLIITELIGTGGVAVCMLCSLRCGQRGFTCA